MQLSFSGSMQLEVVTSLIMIKLWKWICNRKVITCLIVIKLCRTLYNKRIVTWSQGHD
jgi:hypothetical protein